MLHSWSAAVGQSLRACDGSYRNAGNGGTGRCGTNRTHADARGMYKRFFLCLVWFLFPSLFLVSFLFLNSTKI